MQNVRVVGSGKHPSRLQKTREDGQCAPEKAMCEVVSVKPKLQWKPQKIGEARNMDHIRKYVSRDQNQPKRSHGIYSL